MYKKKICLFMRKPIKEKHFSLENVYYELFKKFYHKNFEIKFKVCPLESRGILRRIYLCIWAFFNQGSINHVSGDINFISLFMNKEKTINTFHDFYSMQRLKGIKRFLYYIFWVKVPYLKSKSVTTISNKTFKELKNIIEINNEKKIYIIGNPTPSFKKKIKKQISKIPKILVIGTAINKNISNIISSLKNISCELILIGELNDEIIQELILNKINYKNLVSISKKKLINEYIKSDILLFPSNYEGFGMPILEAQSIGRPVITSKFEPMRNVAGNGAIFVNPEKISEISKAVKIIINNKKLRKFLIKKGFNNIKRFKKEIILKEHLKVYNETINNL